MNAEKQSWIAIYTLDLIEWLVDLIIWIGIQMIRLVASSLLTLWDSNF